LYLAYVLNKFKNNPFSHTKNKSSDEKEGDVTIDKMPKGNSKNKNVGDYIDYEEID
tara:strand:+ start:719 stop:886 length:168 start_codon:yes stop_codon:yes gene_type:complete